MAAGILILHNCITSIVLIVWDSLSELDVVIHTFQRGKSMVRPSPIRPGRTMQVSLQVLTSSYWHWSCTKSSNKHAHHNSQQMSYLVTWMMTLPASQQPYMDHPVGNLCPVGNLSSSRSTSARKCPGSTPPMPIKKRCSDSTSNETAPFKLLISPAVYQQGWVLYIYPTQPFDQRSMHCPTWILLGARGTCLQH